MKNKPDIRPFVRQFFRRNVGLLVLSFVQTLFLVAANMLISWLIQVIVDLVGGTDVGFTLGQLFGISGISLVLICISVGLAYISRPRFVARAMAQYKVFVFAELSRKGISAFSGENSALYVSALSNDVAAIEKGYIESIFNIVDQMALCIAALVMMLCYSPVLTLIAIGLTAFPILASVLTGNRMAEAEKQVSDRNERYISTLRDSLVGFSVIKSFRAEAQICRIFAREVRCVAQAKERRQKMDILVQGFGALAGVLLQIGIFLIGAYLALSGRAGSAGSVMVFVQLLNYVLNPVQTVPQAMAQFRAAEALIGKLATALQENVRQEGTIEKRELKEGICLEGVSFGYEADKPVLQNIHFRFEKGRSYCVVGSSGSGKSTLLNLLMASHQNYTGKICYDDVELSEISSAALFEMVSVVQQNVFIFNASIRDNITMFSEFSNAQVERAMELSGLTELVSSRGEDYLCGENGSGLSGGEKQRISIARSLLKNANVLLVDEATASLDTKTASQVSHAILNLQGITRIVVTHALDAGLLSRYDCILTLKNGAVAETGSFTELMERKGYFYSLYTVSQ